MRLRRGRFRIEDLVICTTSHYEWRCIECFEDLSQASTGVCPPCPRCGGRTAPVSGAQNEGERPN